MKNQISTIKYQIYFILSIFIFLFFIFNITQASADGISLSVSPSILQMEVIPPVDAHAQFMLQNQSDQTIKLKVTYKLFEADESESGDIRYLSDKDPFPGKNKRIFNNISVVDENNYSYDTIKLGPKQQKKLNLLVSLAKDEPYSDYYFSVIFLSVPADLPGDNDFTAAQGGIAMNVLLSVGPANQAKGSVEEFSAPTYVDSGPVPFTLKVKNDSAHYIYPKGNILITNMFGQTIGKVDIPATNILAGSNRYMKDTLQLTNATASATFSQNAFNQNSPHPQAFWQESFLLGYYTASLSLSLSDKGPVITRTLHFFAFPVKIIFGLIVAATIVLIIVMRVRKKLKTR